MKSLEELLAQPPVYLHDWAENEKIGVISDFDDIYMTKSEYEAEKAPYANVEMWQNKKVQMAKALKDWEPINILFASYSYQDYSGDAFVLFERDGNLYEVNGGHCSCYGLEGQFSPEETDVDVLKHRLVEGRLGCNDYCGNEFSSELKKFLGIDEQ